MTLRELIEELENLAEEHGEANVHLAFQRNWPLEYSVSQVVVTEVVDERDGVQQVVYIGEGSQLGYLPGVAREALGW